MANTPAPQNVNGDQYTPPQFAPVKQFDPVKAMQLPDWRQAQAMTAPPSTVDQHQAGSQDKYTKANDGAHAAGLYNFLPDSSTVRTSSTEEGY